MTPKEKAIELFGKFYIEVLDRDGTSTMNELEAKQCALIAVDKIIEVAYWNSVKEFYKKVKQEIEKL